MSVLKKFAGQTLVYGFSTIIARVLNFVLTPLFVSKFPAAVYGVFTNLYSWAALINNLLAFGMETTFFRFLDKHEGDKRAVFNVSFLTIVFTSLVFLLSLFLFRNEAAGLLSNWLGTGADLSSFKEYITFFAFILVADALAVIPFAKLRADGRAMRFAWIKLFNILAVVALNLFFIVVVPQLIEAKSLLWLNFESWYRPGWLGYVFISNLIASLLTLLFLLPELRFLQLRLDVQLLRKMTFYSFPILIGNISFVINELLDKMVLLPKLLPAGQAATDLGIYGAVSKLAIFLSIVVQGFRLGAEPFFFSQAKEKNARRIYALIMDYFVIIMVLGMIGLTANIEFLKYFIKSGDPVEQANYWSGLPIVPVLLLSYVLLGIYTNLTIWYKLADQTRFAIYISGIGAVVTVVLNVIFIPLYSYVGAACVTLVAYAVMVIVSYYWGQKHYPIPYNVLKNLSYVVFGALTCWVSFFVLDRDPLFGNLLFLAFLVVTIKLEKATVLGILKRK